jgi:hypothetical protein
MASWAGQPSIKGSSETLRMILLTFSTIGFTYVKVSLPHTTIPSLWMPSCHLALVQSRLTGIDTKFHVGSRGHMYVAPHPLTCFTMASTPHASTTTAALHLTQGSKRRYPHVPSLRASLALPADHLDARLAGGSIQTVHPISSILD